jgi:hypothetical protein
VQAPGALSFFKKPPRFSKVFQKIYYARIVNLP